MKIRYGVLLICLFILLLWLVPIKCVVFDENKIQKYIDDGYSVLICEYQAITGPLWRVDEYYGISTCPPDIDIIGSNIPYFKLRTPVYDGYNHDKFIFIGKFSSEYNSIFEVEKWNIIGWKKSFLYPRYGFNIFEYKIRVDENAVKEYNNAILQHNIQYKKDGIVK